MTSKNTTNFNFLKDFKPELYAFTIKMEEDLLIAPISLLAYSTRFLEFILHDIADNYDYDVNMKVGFVDKVNQLRRFNYLDNGLDYNLYQLLIDAYNERSRLIHNHDIEKSLSDDKKAAFRLNETLLYVAEAYYKMFNKGDEDRVYIESHKSQDGFDDVRQYGDDGDNANIKLNSIKKSKIGYVNVVEKDEGHQGESISTDSDSVEKLQFDLKNSVKQDKIFDKCIICGESSKTTKSNFCQYCDNLLDYRNVLVRIITNKRTNLLKKEDFDYSLKDQLISDLIELNVLKTIGNSYKILYIGLNDFFRLTDKFMGIDEFLVEVTKDKINPYESKLYSCNEYPYNQVSNRVDDYKMREFIKLLENGYSQKNALKQIGVNQHIFNNWYMNRKYEFTNGNKDDLFVKYHELLIVDMIKLASENKYHGEHGQKFDFWVQYFEEFIEKLPETLTEDQLNVYMLLFNKNTSKTPNISDEELNERKELMLEYIGNYNFNIALKKSKLDVGEVQKAKDEFLNGKNNRFYRELSQKLMTRYLILRNKGKTTYEICRKLAIDENEIELWVSDNRFKDFQFRFNRTHLNLLKDAIDNKQSYDKILNILEMDNEQLIDLIGFMNVDTGYPYKRYINEYFTQNTNIDVSLKNSILRKKELNGNSKRNKTEDDEVVGLKIEENEKIRIEQGKQNSNQFTKLNLTKEKQFQYGEENRIDNQIMALTNGISGGKLLLTASKVHCDVDDVFNWILMGSQNYNEFTKLADAYWNYYVTDINLINSNKKKNILGMSVLKYHLNYWKKWGLIGKMYNNLSIRDIKNILKDVK